MKKDFKPETLRIINQYPQICIMPEKHIVNGNGEKQEELTEGRAICGKLKKKYGANSHSYSSKVCGREKAGYWIHKNNVEIFRCFDCFWDKYLEENQKVMNGGELDEQG